MSVTQLLHTTLNSIPKQVPYIFPDPHLVEKWRSRLAPSGSRRKIGIAWAGNPANAADATRSIPLQLFEPLPQLDKVELHSLQVGPAAAQISALPHLQIISYSAESLNFSETAALIANLDLVISADTAMAHLAGALGKPVWILLRLASDWRWFLSGDSSPWYPTARLFRQKSSGEWKYLMARVAAELPLLL